MSRTESFRVDSIHINVGAGDCAIHLLLQVSGSFASTNYDNTRGGIVVAAVLIDGGVGSVFAVGDNYLLNRIAVLYQLPTGTSSLKFDSVVVTHWDQDHYLGLWNIINANINENASTTQQCSFLKYGDATGRNNPLTTLYAPYWAVGDSTISSNGKGYTSSRLSLDTTSQRLTVDSHNNVCKVVHGYRELIGRDFFKAQDVSGLAAGVQFESINNVDALLLSTNRLQAVTRPGLYCVGADNQVIGNAVGAADALTLGSALLGKLEVPMGIIEDVESLPVAEDLTSAPVTEHRKRPVHLVNANPSPSNKSSVICMVVWDEARTTAPGVGKIRHYTAGDAEWQTEVLVSRWTGADGTTVRVPAVKLSHHGAASSSPISMLSNYNPDLVIASCGHRHTHPRWEIVLWLYLKNKARKTTSTEYIEKPLRTMCFATWLNKKWEQPPSMEALWSSSGKAFVAEVQGLATVADNEIRDFLTAAKTSAQENAYRDWIIDYLNKVWSDVSPVSLDIQAFGSMTTARKDAAVLDEKIRYWLVRNQESAYGAYNNVWGTDPVSTPKNAGDDFTPLTTGSTATAATAPVSSTPAPSTATAAVPANPTPVSNAATLSLVGPPGLTTRAKRRASQMAVSGLPFVQGLLDKTDAPRMIDLSAVNPPITAVFHADPFDTTFRILCSSRWTPASKSAGAAFTPTADFDDFISLLDYGCITLAGVPTGSELQSGTPIADEDGWLYWMKTNGMNATSMRVLATPTSSGDYNIGAMDITLTLNSASPTSPQLGFTTDPAKSSFPDQSMRNPPSAGMSTNGYLEELGMLILGLDTSASSFASVPVLDVMKFFGLDPVFFFELAQDIRLTLDRSAKSRNALWFFPALNYRTDLRLQFTIDAAPSAKSSPLQTMLDQIFKGAIGVKDPTLVLRKTVTRSQVTSDNISHIVEASTELIVSATFTSGDFEATGSIDFQPRAFAVELQWQDPNKKLDVDKLFAWVSGLVQKVTNTVGLPSFLSFIPKPLLHAAQEASKAINIRSIRFTVENMSTTETPNLSLRQLKIVLEVDTSLGRTSGSDGSTPVFLTYSWPSNEFTGTISEYKLPDPSQPPKNLLPIFEPCWDMTPYSAGISNPLTLSNLIPGMEMPAPPQGLPDRLEYLALTINPTEIYFEASITADPSLIRDKTCPPIIVEDVTLEVMRVTDPGSSKSQSMFSLCGYVVMKPRAPSGSTTQPNGQDARLQAVFTYNAGRWSVAGTVDNLSMSYFYSWIEDGYRSSTMDLLDKIRVNHLFLEYDYEKDIGSNFTFHGEIVFGQLALALDYTYNKTQKDDEQVIDWLFHAGLGAESADKSNKPTLKSVIASICGQGVADNIPNCADFPIGTPDNPTADMLDLVVQKTGDGNHVFFRLQVNLPDGIAFTFVQMQEKDSSGEPKSPKRVVRISVSDLPSISGVPMVGTVKAPVDEIDYVWVHDDNDQNPGLTFKEVTVLNTSVMKGEALKWESHSNKPPGNDDVVLEAGSHFIVSFKGNVVLDYVFGRPESQSAHSVALGGKSDKQGDQGPSGPTTKAPVTYTIGPLSISNLGLKFHDNVLSIVLDATLTAGPVTFEILDLTVCLDLSNASLHQLSTLIPSVSLNGLGIQIDTPPVIITGTLVHEQSDDGDEWLGGLTVEIEPYSIMAIGGFGTFHDNTSGGTFHTLFVYGQFTGPLLDIDGIILVTGLRVGLGYNSSITNPDLNTIFQFPLLSHDVGDEDPNPLAMMTAFCKPTNGIQWIVPKNDSYWVAFGIDALLFDMIGVSAIVIFSDLSAIHIFADATAVLPAGEDPNKDHPVLWVEFGIISTEDLRTGNVIFQGQLSPNSYVLDPSCHLSGGFAMGQWPAQNLLQQDDWVMSVGGYHTCHTKVKTSRGMLKASFNAGVLGAHFDAWADFLINVDPFFFSGSVGVSVGVDFTLDLWICTIHISCSIGADLYIHGPPFQGHVHVNFWVFGFDVWFGGGDSKSDPLNFDQFWNMLDQGAGGEDPSTSEGPLNAKLLHTVQNGMVASRAKAKTERGGRWFIRGGTFTFRVESRFPVTKVVCGSAVITSKDDLIKVHEAFAKPMQVSTPVESELDISVVDGDGASPQGDFRLTAIVKDVPRAIWDSYNPSTDPIASGNNHIDDLMHGDAPTIKVMMGVSVTVPKPTIANDGIPTFNAIEAMKEDVNPDLPHQGPGSGDPLLAVTPPLQAHWAPQTTGLDNFQSKWSNANTAALKALTTEWETFLGWPTEDTALKSVLPTGLVAGYKDMCMAVPKIAVG